MVWVVVVQCGVSDDIDDDSGTMVIPNTEIQSNKTCDPLSGRTVSKHRAQN